MSERIIYTPLVDIARNKLWGDGGLIRDEDQRIWSFLKKIDKARYLGARDNCDVVETLAKDPNYGPEYQIVRYGSVNFWYSYLKGQMAGIKKFESFGAPIDLQKFGGLGNFDPGWVPNKGFLVARGPATYHAYTLPRQIIDIIKLSEKLNKGKHLDKTKKIDFTARQSFEAVDSVLTSPSLDASVLKLAVHSKKLGLSTENIRARVFDEGYKRELPEKYWGPIYERIESLLESKGL